LTQPLRFELLPLSPEFERVWQHTLNYIRSFDDIGTPLFGASKAAFDEYLLTLLLHQHPHNYSDELAKRTPTPVPGVVRRAERYIAEHADTPITVSDVAAGLGISLRSLQQGFRQFRSTTPLTYLRQVRLQRVREELLSNHSEENITEIALRHGFSHLGRFSAYYRSTFGEAPSVTWRRGKRSGGRK
jgi:AraC-like DNA-binding protein